MTCLFALIFTYSFMKFIVLHILSVIVAVQIIVHCFALLDACATCIELRTQKSEFYLT